jgi:L-fuconolactonase
MRIDAHQHFWDPARGDYGWLTPAMGPIHRPFAPSDLAPILAHHRIDGTILVQAAPTVAETEYLLGLAATAPFVKGVVGWVDFENKADLGAIERLSANPRLKGFRPMIQDIADDGWMLRPALRWAFDALAERGLAFDALIKPRHLTNLLRLAERHPGLRIVVDHGAKPSIKDGAFDDWARDMAAVAANTNATCKLSGLVTEAGPDWSASGLKPYVNHLLAVFGPNRLMFGSDWPVSLLAASYDRWLETAEALTAALDPAARAEVFGGSAARFYRL